VEFGDDLEMRAKAAAESMYKGKAKARDVARSADWFMRHPEAIPGDESAVIGQLPSGGKRQQSSGVEAVAGGAALTGFGTWQHRTAEELGRGWRHLPRATQVLGIGVAGMGVERLLQERKARRLARQKQETAFAARELAARSGRIVEFGDGEADEAVLAALKAAASADESSAQRAMLLKSGLIEMVKGQLVINERGYDMMKKAGVPPKLTPEERREEIMGTEEKRLSRFEFARGDYAIPAMKKILNSPSDRHLHEVPGLVGALRGDSAKMQAHYAALGKRNKYYASMAEGAARPGVLRHLRSWAAGAIREARNA
jgi:hypothetical protein